jgi:hypothetical protein
MSPMVELERIMVVRIPRQAIQWRWNVIYILWAYAMSPYVLNGPLRVSLLHRPISTRSAPGSNPQPTGWWTIGLGLRETKPHIFEWAVHGVYQHCFCMLSAVKSYAAVPLSLGDEGSHHGWVFGENLSQPVIEKSRRTRCSR